MSYTPGVLVGIATYNGAHRVEGLIHNIRQRTYGVPYEIVVADDSGRPEHQEKTKAVCNREMVRLMTNPRNLGLPATWNVLCRASNHEMIALLNDDILVAKDWLSYLAYAIYHNPKVGTVSLNARFITPDDAPRILASPDAKVIPLNVRYEHGILVRHERFPSMPEQTDEEPGRVMCPMGALFGFRRQIWEEIGGFDERYRVFYEETDFGVSCAVRGLPAITLPVPHDNYHMWSETFKNAPEIPAAQIMIESRRKFVEKWSGLLGVTFQDAPEIHSLLMDKIPSFEVKWLGVGKRERTAIL